MHYQQFRELRSVGVLNKVIWNYNFMIIILNRIKVTFNKVHRSQQIGVKTNEDNIDYIIYLELRE